MIKRVYTNQHGTVTLDSDMFGKRKRLSTGEKPSAKREIKAVISWYEKNFDEEYRKLYEEKNGPRRDNNISFSEYGESVIEITSENRNEFSRAEVSKAFERLCETFGERDIDSITFSDCQKWQNEMAKTHATATIEKKWRYLLNMILDYARADGVIDRNPMEKLPKPKGKPGREKHFLYEPDFPKLFEVMNEEQADKFAVALFTGVRGGEFIGMKWHAVSFEKRAIHIDVRIRDGVEAAPKTDAGHRIIPMSDHVLEALLRQRKRTGHQDYVWLTLHGKPYRDHEALSKSLKKLALKAGLPPVTMHDLRRSYNTLLKNKGYGTDVIFQWMGHISENVNRAHYTGVVSADLDAVNNVRIA